MAAWADASERFVEIPNIVEIRWVSDDPDYYVEPIDLFDEQKNGLPDWYGKKDKTTTEQAFFTCNVCECDLKSVVTLRAHCKGTQHIRKALQKKKEWRVNLKKEAKEQEAKTEKFKTLFDWLDQGTSEAVVGLEHVTEYLSGDMTDMPYYHCDLEHCRDEQGDAEKMKNHILSARHKQAWLEIKTGSFLKHQTEISQRIAEFTKDFKRDFRDMKVVEDREKWNMAKQGRIKGERPERFRAKKENLEERDRSPGRGDYKRGIEYEERGEPRKVERGERYDRRERSHERKGNYGVKRERSSGYEREKSSGYERERSSGYERERSSGYERERSSGYERERSNVYERERSHGYERERSSGRERSMGYERERSREYKQERRDGVDRDRSPVRGHDGRREDTQSDSRRVKREQSGRREEEESFKDAQMYRGRISPRRERVMESGSRDVEEVSRSGNFDNWSTAMVKADPMDSSMASTSSKPVSTTTQQKSVSEEVDRLHRKVATKVMKNLNKFYPGAEEFEPSEHKIGSPEEYSRLAKKFSHQLRRQIKESYEAYHSTLEGIVLTPDHEQFIRTEVESYFEGVPRVR